MCQDLTASSDRSGFKYSPLWFLARDFPIQPQASKAAFLLTTPAKNLPRNKLASRVALTSIQPW
jgi:hypothetical protein